MNKIFVRKEAVMPYEKMCKVQGDPIRHFEQLWDEIKKLKERIVILEKIVEDI
jgi:hypothetical protein